MGMTGGIELPKAKGGFVKALGKTSSKKTENKLGRCVAAVSLQSKLKRHGR